MDFLEGTIGSSMPKIIHPVIKMLWDYKQIVVMTTCGVALKNRRLVAVVQMLRTPCDKHYKIFVTYMIMFGMTAKDGLHVHELLGLKEGIPFRRICSSY